MEKMDYEKMQLFEDQEIRSAWDEENEEWYFSIVDVISVLTETAEFDTARKYWNKMKQRLNNEGSQLVTNCHQLNHLGESTAMVTQPSHA